MNLVAPKISALAMAITSMNFSAFRSAVLTTSSMASISTRGVGVYLQMRAVSTVAAVRRDLEAQIDKWDDQLSSIGDDAQLANIDLQNALQKQQQMLQTISNVSKAVHDTAMAIIRKIGG